MTLYATDLDGTLLNTDKNIPEKAVQTLNKLIDSGVLFTYATARSFSSAAPLVKKLKLSCPAVTFNGVFVIDPATGEHLAENVFSEEAFQTAVDFFNKHKLAPLVYSYIDGRERVSYLTDRYSDVKSYVSSRQDDKRLRAVNSREELFMGKVFYFTLLNPDISQEMLYEIFSRDNGFALNIMEDTYEKGIFWYEIFSRNASKANALTQVMELTHADRLVCFGDNTNDISMIQAADVGVCVANSCNELKELADAIIGSCNDGAVAEYIAGENISFPAITNQRRFSAAVDAAAARIQGLHGSIGTHNEKLIHAALKNYYAPFADEQEIKIGKYFADAVNENGIYEIQTRRLNALNEKLSAFTQASQVTIVHPVEVRTRNIYINRDGEIISEAPFRNVNKRQLLYRELYSMRKQLRNERITIILAKLVTEKRIAGSGNTKPNMNSRSARKKLDISKIPLELKEETIIPLPDGLRIFLPDNLPEQFTKKQFCEAAGEPYSSLRLEVLRAAGIITQNGKQGRCNIYSVSVRKEMECQS